MPLGPPFLETGVLVPAGLAQRGTEGRDAGRAAKCRGRSQRPRVPLQGSWAAGHVHVPQTHVQGFLLGLSLRGHPGARDIGLCHVSLRPSTF